MDPSPAPEATNDARPLLRLTTTTSCLVLALACVVLVGWIAGVPTLTSVIADYPAMKFNTALCLAALSVEALVNRRSVRLGLVLFVLGVAGTTLAEIVLGRSLGAEQWFFQDALTTAGATGRMAPPTAAALVALAVGSGLLNLRRYRVVQAILVVLALASVTVLLGYLYDAHQLYRLPSFVSVSLPTAAGTLLLTVAMAARIPDGLLAWALVGHGPGSLIVRYSVPTVAVGLVVIGFLRIEAADAGIIGEHVAVAAMVLMSVVIAVGTTVVAGRRLDAADRRRATAEAWMQQVNRSLQDGRDHAWAQAERFAKDLARVRQRLDGTISELDAVLWTVETTGDQQVPVYVSPNVERILGERLRDGESAAAKLAELMRADQSEAAVEFRRCVREGIPTEAELRLSVDGRDRWMHVGGAPRSEGGRVFYDGIMSDVTDRYELDEQRERLRAQEHEHAEKLSKLDRARDEFVAVAGHELRTPVAVILGYLELLTDPDTPEQSKLESIEVITRRSRDLSDLIEHVFDLAKLNSGALALKVDKVPVAGFIDALLARHATRAAEANIALTADVRGGPVLADEGRLAQVFDTLVANALGHTPSGGFVRISGRPAGGHLVFDLSDDGSAVDDEDLAVMFEGLSAETPSQNPRIAGGGLGLALAKALVEAQGGSIAVRRNSPNGLVFTVTLPVAR